MADPHSGETGWAGRPKNQRLLVRLLLALCALSLLAELFLHKHGHFDFEHWPGVHALLGFGAFALIVLFSGKVLRPLLRRSESYYPDEAEHPGSEAEDPYHEGRMAE